MSKKAIYPLSEYKINKNDPEMKKRINDFYEYQKKGEYYFALYCLEDLLLQDGTSKKYNAIFLNFILDNFEDLMNDINKKKKEIYVKQLTNDGLVSIETYSLADDKKEKSELETILEKINNIESKLLNKGDANVPNNTTNVTAGNANASVG